VGPVAWELFGVGGREKALLGDDRTTRSLSENWKNLKSTMTFFVAIEQAGFPRLRGTMSHP